MAQALSGVEGVKNMLDDIVCFGATQEEHDQRLDTLLKRLKENGVILNREKCEISVDVSELRRLLEMINQFSKFIPRLAEISLPMRRLLCKEAAWYWGPPQTEAFEKIKKILPSAETLGHYSMKNPTRIYADSSSQGLGSLIMQKIDDIWKPIA